MALKFCPSCKTLLIPQGDYSDGFFLFCKDCGFYENLNEDNSITSKEKIPKKEKIGTDPKAAQKVFAISENTCKKCGHNKCYIIPLGIFISDEDELILLECLKCGHVERIGKRCM